MKVLMLLFLPAVSFLMAQQIDRPILTTTQGGVNGARMMDSIPVTGNPYSAQAITETVQVLPDGNRISQQSSAMIYRDGQGRQRREINLNVGNTSIRSVLIVDPVERVTVSLNSVNRVARKTAMPPQPPPLPSIPPRPPNGGSLGVLIPLSAQTAGWLKAKGFDHGADIGAVTPGGPADQAGLKTHDIILNFNGQPVKDGADLIARVSTIPPGTQVVIDLDRGGKPLEVKMVTGDRATVSNLQTKAAAASPPLPVLQSLLSGGGVTFAQIEKSKTENLATDTIEGLTAQGMRITTPVAAGEVGNERPFDIVNEVWYSTDLKVIVISKHSDPRTGDVTYRLTNIVRSEPAASMFEVPADYTVSQTPGPDLVMPARIQ
jgi:hypothetical protein